eukprot:TRINITY_DN3949_c0_g1_i2.p1 TRINITY_DN3949_c0_g1~~TRINITY_DN3949_c0_g1_i2.p1  ORF type:complete len:178 (+),score=11.35 TRINITY_DN3949_c0_g1_i2:175-708(+)
MFLNERAGCGARNCLRVLTSVFRSIFVCVSQGTKPSAMKIQTKGQLVYAAYDRNCAIIENPDAYSLRRTMFQRRLWHQLQAEFSKSDVHQVDVIAKEPALPSSHCDDLTSSSGTRVTLPNAKSTRILRRSSSQATPSTASVLIFNSARQAHHPLAKHQATLRLQLTLHMKLAPAAPL